MSDAARREVSILYSDLKKMGEIFGVMTQEPDVYFQEKKSAGLAGQSLSSEEIDSLVKERIEARKSKDFARADEIRDMLAQKNIVLKDGPTGTSWEIK